MDKLELYYDHYKETYALSKQVQTRRNTNFIVLCVFEALSFMLLVRPEKAIEFFSAGINAHFDTTLMFGNSVVQTLLWILIAYFIVRYCQDALYVERSYTYLNKLEKEISNENDSTIFDREGDGYLRDYPMVLNFIDLFYKMFSPVLFATINVVRIIKEWRVEKLTFALVCDTAIFAVIIIITWFYFFEIHSKITEWCKRHIPFVGIIAKALRNILREV